MWEYLQRRGKKSIFLTIIRIYLGLKWTVQGYNKITSKSFDASGFLKGAVEKAKATGADSMVQDWWAFIVKFLFLPNVEVLNYLIPVTELFVGVFLLTGSFTRRALYVGIILNFLYLLSGSLSVNPQMILLSLLLLKAKDNAGRVGMDGWVFVSMKKRMSAPAAGSAKPPM
ncbi:DoxX family membrane protein [Ectobacillus panaciterrae]|uniref:DoxX family membrane protein n=1 Tax=Ectobacillus panaciterrae TaxID=363872 RepID=UPI0003FB90F5|nr:DoxX family membrane protein [Ectobacillus panaciterrae]